MRFRVLGPLEVADGDQVVTPTAPKTAGVLTLLLLHANHLVLTETLTEELWRGGPPPSASTTLQTYVYQLRCAYGRDIIVTRPGGYCLPAKEVDLDLLAFRAGVVRGQALLEEGRPDEALMVLQSCLTLWRGRPLTNVPTGPTLDLNLAHLEEERRRAAELSIEAAFAAGRQREVIGAMKQMANDDPYDEWLHARLMEALMLTGRRGEALQVYASVRQLLADQLGLDPMQELRDLERQILSCPA